MLRNKLLFFLKFHLLALAVLTLQWLVAPALLHWQQADFIELQTLKKHMNDPRAVLFFGDSTLIATSRSDRDTRSTSTMLQQFLPQCRVVGISFPASHAEIYLDFIRYMLRHHGRPALVIVLINLRSLAPIWDLHSGWQFYNERILLQEGPASRFLQPLNVFKFNFTSVVAHRQRQAVVMNGDRPMGLFPEIERIRRGRELKIGENVRNRFLLSYMAHIRRDNRKWQAIWLLSGLLDREGIPLLFYITPVDCISGEQFWPGEFQNRVAYNTQFITAGLSSVKVELLDFSQSLAPEYFFWRQEEFFPNEHLREKGRIWLANHLQLAALPLLKQRD